MAKSTDIVAVDATPVAVRSETDQITQMLNLAIEKNISVEAMEKLVTLHERVADRAAASEFAGAMASFQGECPPIPKQSKAVVKKNGVVQYEYFYAELDAIAKAVNPRLGQLGLSYSWDGVEREGGVESTCTLRHVNGHSISSKFGCPVDTRAAMNAPQQISAAMTTAKRMSLIQVLGLTTCEADTDSNPQSADTITEQQAADLRALAQEAKVSDARIFKVLKVTSYEAVLASDYAWAVKQLDDKRRGK